MEGHIFTEDLIDENYPKSLKAQVARLGKVDKIIHHIATPGGDCYAGYEGWHFLKSLGLPIKSVVEGQAQSMGTFMALAGDEVEILDPSVWMIHNPRMGSQGDADALSGGSSALRKIEDAMAKVYFEKNQASAAKNPEVIRLSFDEVKAMMKKETTMNAEETVKYGFADRMITPTGILKNQSPEQYSHLKAVALGTEKMEDKTLADTIKEGFTNILAKINGTTTAQTPPTPIVVTPPPAPKSLDLALKDGNMLVVQTENGDLVGKTATVNGSPAQDGTHDLGDGRQIVVAGGVITEVKEPETPEQKASREAQAAIVQAAADKKALEDQLAAAKAAEEKAKQEAATAATALSTIKTDLENLQLQTVGDDKNPNRPAAAVIMNGQMTEQERLKLYATRTFLAEHMPQLEHNYAGGKFKDGTRFSDYAPGRPNAVSILETNLSYTWNGNLSLDLFFKPTLNSPALTDIFTVDTGSADKKQYHIAPVMNKVLKPYTGCDQAVTGSQYSITSKSIQLKPFEMYEGWCKDDFTKQLLGQYNILAQEWLKTGTESFDPAGTPVDRIIIQALKDALRRDIFRRVSFARSGNSSADWNQITGFWTSLIDQSGASNYCVYRYGSALGTAALAAGTALTYLQGIYNNSSNLLKQQAIDSGRGQFLVTRSVWENYYDSLVAAGNVSADQYNNLQRGITKLEYKGIPVIPVTIWDDFLADSTNPLYSTTRHLIAFTLKDNHILGVENTADLGKIDSWFEKKDNKRYYRSNMTLGFLGPIHCDLTTISY